MANRNYYMVRAMFSRDDDFEIFFRSNVVAVGWSEVDFTGFSDVAKLQEEVYRVYYEGRDISKRLISKYLNAVERFKNIKKGDYILVPFNSSIVLAEAEEKEIYSDEGYKNDLANQRRAVYRYENGKLLTIPRDELTEGLQRRLRVPGSSVANLFEFKDEIETIFSRGSYSYSQEMQDTEQKEMKKLKTGLLRNIQEGKTNLKTGGIGLENLVRELMECEGYEAKILAKNKFAGKADADIHAIKEDSFMSKKLFVQIKHHSGYSDKQGIQQLIDVLAQEGYEEYEGYFITSALVPDDVRAFAETNNIEVMDGNALVELIVNNLNRLPETTKRLLGICTIPHVLPQITI